jgi:hypothetical protein
MTLRGSSALPTALVIGAVNGSNAPPGTIGEYISSTILGGFQLTSATPANITSMLLSAGDWDAWGVIDYTIAGDTPHATLFSSGISGTSGAFGPQAGGPGFGADPTLTLTLPDSVFASGTLQIQATPKIRINITVPTTVYLVGQANFSGGAAFVSTGGTIQARRQR